MVKMCLFFHEEKAIILSKYYFWTFRKQIFYYLQKKNYEKFPSRDFLVKT